MKKILLSMALVGSLFGDVINLDQYKSENGSLSIYADTNIEGCYESDIENEKCHFHVFIDTDKNSNTGLNGWDYRVTGSKNEIKFYEYPNDNDNNWDNWQIMDYDSLSDPETRVENNKIYLQFSEQGNSTLNVEDAPFQVDISKGDNLNTASATLDHQAVRIDFGDNNANNDPVGTINDIIVGENTIEINGNFEGIGHHNIYVDTDNNINTGYGEIGAEYLIGANYENGTFSFAQYDVVNDNWINWENINTTKTNNKITIDTNNFNHDVFRIFVKIYDNNWNKLGEKNITVGTNVLSYEVNCNGADDAINLQTAFNDYEKWKNNTLIFPKDGECIVSTGINWENVNGLEGNPYIIQGNGATLKYKGADKKEGQAQKGWLLWVDNASYIEINNLTFDGNRDNRKILPEEENGIPDIYQNRNRNTTIPPKLEGSNIVFENKDIFQRLHNSNLILRDVRHSTLNYITSNFAVQDGIYIGWNDDKNNEYPNDIQLNNCSASYAFRNNLTISNCINCTVNGGSYTHAIGVAPEAGIDVECDTENPESIINNFDNQCLKNIYIFNTIIKDNNGVGISVPPRGRPKNVKIENNNFMNNHHSERSCDSKGIAITAGMYGGTIKNNFFTNILDKREYDNGDNNLTSPCRSFIDFGDSDEKGDMPVAPVTISSNNFTHIKDIFDEYNKKIIYIHSGNIGKHNIEDNNFTDIGLSSEDFNNSKWFDDDCNTQQNGRDSNFTNNKLH